MLIDPIKVPIKELFDGYVDNDDDGVVGYGGRLNIRPAFQRKFIYSPKEQELVIDTILNEFPLNVMYWTTKDGKNFEMLDGQQRTISICRFLQGKFSIQWKGNERFIDNLLESTEIIENYELDVFVCTGTDEEKLDWFQRINIAGKVLALQEIRNAIYTGPWVSDAKKYFSKKTSTVQTASKKIVSANFDRQGYLELAIKWDANAKKDADIRKYMAERQNQTSAKHLWDNYLAVIDWVKEIYVGNNEKGNIRPKIMPRVDWNRLYREHGQKHIDPEEIQALVSELVMDAAVKNKAGIYEYVLTKDPQRLDIRIFDENIKLEKFEEQKGICEECKKKFDFEDMEADHISAWKKGGLSDKENCQMLCMPCNRKKSAA